MAELDRATLRHRFAIGDRHFASSPLYRELARAVAADERLLDLAAGTRPGQQPANMLMAAVHRLVLLDPAHPFARFFPSAVGERAAVAPDAAGAELAGFCTEHHDAIAATLRTRLVQTNVPGRGVSVRFALAEVARRTVAPVTFLEVGPSAGIQLRFDRWAVDTGGRRFGPPDAPVTLTPQWRGDAPPPDLDALPRITQRLGIDLHPVDATDPEERLWQRALVWPEHLDRLDQLTAALDAVAADPPEIIAGDAIELLAGIDERLEDPDAPLVVFHGMVRIHVPRDRRAAFDAAIERLAERRRVWHVSLEIAAPDSPHRDRGHLLNLIDSAGADAALAVAEGHGRWIEPLP